VNVDVKSLSALIADRLRLVAVELVPLDVECAWPVYRAAAIGCAPMLVKVTERAAAERTLSFLSSAKGCPFLPRPILADAPSFEGHAVLCLEWKASARVNAEDMTEGQLGSFAEGCRILSEVLARYRGPITPLAEEDLPCGRYAALREYAGRHPVMARLLKPLLDIPEGEREYGARELAIIHGDLQPKNYGFDGDRLAAIYDTDDLTTGLACEDAAYAFTERARRSELSAARRRRLTELFLRLVELSPSPKDEWLIAVNHSRLRIAARRLEKRPDSIFVAVDIARRDKPLRLLAEALRRRDA
jgi:hypothetical protein